MDIVGKHKMLSYSKFLSKVSSARQPSIIRELLKIMQSASKDMIPLSGGLPNPKMFPFEEFAFKLKDGTTKHIAGNEMVAALQYLPTNGYAELLER